MTGAVARAAIVPLYRDPTLRAEQVSQLVLGETARVEDARGEWRRVTAEHDGYAGWVHAGYIIELDAAAVARWRTEADCWSLGATVRLGGEPLRLPLRARVAVEGDVVRLPDGRRGPAVEGLVRRAEEVAAAAARTAPERWALAHFAGAPYQWGGVTPWGVDCSGLVQTTFAARGLALPRDAALQADCGTAVSPDAARAGDLLFFRGEEGPRITHVAFAAAGDTLIHSTVACGGVVEEPWSAGTRAWTLRERLVGARRIS